MFNQRQILLIIGASARYAAESANRAGFDCVAVDLFSDWDLQKVAETHRVDSFRRIDVKALLAGMSRWPGQFIVTGGMEKRPELVARLSQRLVYRGTVSEQIIRCKNPFVLADVCKAEAIRFPTSVSLHDRNSSPDSSPLGRWLLKPFRSSGGGGIGMATECSLSALQFGDGREKYFLQRQIPGWNYSSVFVASHKGTHLLGSTRQLVGLPVTHARQFAYCGSVGPLQLPDGVNQELLRMGMQLAAAFQLQGVFGLDWIQDRAGRIWLVEINPRLPSSAEILELSGACPSVVGIQIDPDCGSTLPVQRGTGSGMVGKAVLYCDRERIVSESDFRWLIENFRLPLRRSIADIPHAGTRLAVGAPVLTVYHSGSCVAEVLRGLSLSARHIQQKLISSKPNPASN